MIRSTREMVEVNQHDKVLSLTLEPTGGRLPASTGVRTTSHPVPIPSNRFPEKSWGTGIVVAEWSFLTNDARVPMCIADDPGIRLRDIASTLGSTERTAYGIVTDLTEGGHVVKEKDGRRNRYQIQADVPLRDPITRERTIGEVLDVLVGTSSRRRRATKGEARDHAGRRKAAPLPPGACALQHTDVGASTRGRSHPGSPCEVPTQSGLERLEPTSAGRDRRQRAGRLTVHIPSERNRQSVEKVLPGALAHRRIRHLLKAGPEGPSLG